MMNPKSVSNQPAFQFRHRVGQLNWKLITSLNLDEVIEDGMIYELQSVLDNVTFSMVTTNDIKNNSIDSTRHLLHTMQLIIEYLLYCQENQYKMMQSLHKRNTHLKNSMKMHQRENQSLIEDAKIYQRQLAILRQSLSKAQDMIRDKKMNNGKDTLATDENDGNLRNQLNMEMIQNLMTDHRSTYMKDIEHMFSQSLADIIKAVQTTNAANSSSLTSNVPVDSKHDVFNEFRENIEAMLKSTISVVEQKTISTLDSMKKVTADELESSRMNQSKALPDDPMDHINQLRKTLESSLADINRREEEVHRKELDLKNREEEFERLQAQWTSSASVPRVSMTMPKKASIALSTDWSSNQVDSQTSTDNPPMKTTMSVATSMSMNHGDFLFIRQRYQLGAKLLKIFMTQSKSIDRII